MVQGIFSFRIDGQEFSTDSTSLTGREILAMTGRNHNDCRLVYRMSDGTTAEVGPHEQVDFRAMGAEEFMTVPLNQIDG